MMHVRCNRLIHEITGERCALIEGHGGPCGGNKENVMTWQPIETAPKGGKLVDLWVVGETGKGYRITSSWWSVSNGKWFDPDAGWGEGDYLDASEIATHWMPLPTPPDETVKG